MDDSNNRAGNTQKNESEQLLKDRKSDATSKETLTDVKRDEKVPDAQRSGEGTTVTSPDGTPEPDRGGGRADGSDSGGPM